MKLENFEQQVFFSTVRIELPNKKSVGTGFLIKIPSGIPGQMYIILVSNRHILSDSKEELRIIFHIKEKDKNFPKLGDGFPVAITEAKSGSYYAHPNSEVDLACINISELFNLGKEIYWKGIELDMFADFSESGLEAGKEVVFVGYPNNRFDRVNNLPILRGGKIASIPKIDYENRPVFLIDAQVFPGSSGSPVFSVINNQYKFIGVVSETMITMNKLEIKQVAMDFLAQEIIGIGIVHKSNKVKELLLNAVEILNKDKLEKN